MLATMMKRARNIAAINEGSVTAVQARARVNRFLLSQVGSQFSAGEPEPDVVNELWQVPLLLITPGLVVGQVGEAIVSMNTREIISHTDPEQIYAAAARVRKRHHAAIKASFLRAGKR